MSESDEVKKLLQEKYGQAFETGSSYFSPDQGQYILTAFPAGNPEISFQVNFDKKTKFLKSYYPMQLWEYQASQWLREFLLPHYPHMACRLEVVYNQPFDEKNIPDFSFLLSEHPDQLKLTARIYLFQELSEAGYPGQLAGLLALVKELQLLKVSNTVYTVSFFDPAFAAVNDLQQFHFGFNTVGEGDFEQDHMSYFRCKLWFKLTKDSPLPDASQLFGIRSEDPLQMVFHFF